MTQLETLAYLRLLSYDYEKSTEKLPRLVGFGSFTITGNLELVRRLFFGLGDTPNFLVVRLGETSDSQILGIRTALKMECLLLVNSVL